MKILVTGGAGFIGSHVVDLYIQEGHEVIVVDDLSTGRISNLNPHASFYQMDIRSDKIAEVFKNEKPEIVNHHAAQMEVRRSLSDPVFDAEVNILASIKLAELSRDYGVRKFIHISSGGAIYGEPEYLPCDESHPVNPLSPYGASKFAFEKYLFLFHANFDLDYTILRYANIFGPRQDPYGEAGVVAIFTGQMLQNKPVLINGTGEQIRDFVYVTDCARANLITLENGSQQAYNLGTGIGVSINEIYQHLKNITKYPMDAEYGPVKPGETFRIYLDAKKALVELQWQPEISLKDGLAYTVDYFKQSEVKFP